MLSKPSFLEEIFNGGLSRLHVGPSLDNLAVLLSSITSARVSIGRGRRLAAIVRILILSFQAYKYVK